MALARQRSDWLRAAVMNSWAINRNGMQKSAVDPLQMIPGPFRPPAEPPRKKSAEELAEESRFAWVVLDRCFGGKGHARVE
ncbi:unnamed protein product [Gemmata massiliana]|uniref:Uncharacterized protein n=1 Tax=Gemmata massiliana TaxID=1210884 RepID=A0A6P2DJ37_9BACT|nr:hypothetical protein [Gemmata massiliana]VTS01539.1 unnamed protein product [Gemmata massiliana]